MKNATVIAICVLISAGAALADWDEGDPNKYVQLPDLTQMGLDVKVGETLLGPGEAIKTVLADDFPCYQRGLITDIHIWGSWLFDELPWVDDGTTGGMVPDPGAIRFKLGIWADVPEVLEPGTNEVLEHSHPDTDMAPLWTGKFGPGTLNNFSVRRYNEENIMEGWYDPYTGEHIPSFVPADTVCWQYNFLINESEAFMQEGLSADGKPTVYWLSVDVDVLGIAGQSAQFGWKTSQEHWNDDATWQENYWVIDPGMPEGGFWVPAGPWNELRYPFGHPFETESIDLAFAITPEPATMTLLAIGGLVVLRRRRK